MDEATKRLTKLIAVAPDQLDRMSQKVVSHASRIARISDLRERRRRVDKLARDIGSDVQALEATSKDLSTQCDLVRTSYSELFGGVPITSASDEAYLVQLSLGIQRAATGFVGGINALRKRREIMKGMSGKTEALTKMGDRCRAAITTMIDALERLRIFAAAEFPNLTRKRIGRIKYWWMSKRSGRTTRPEPTQVP